MRIWLISYGPHKNLHFPTLISAKTWLISIETYHRLADTKHVLKTPWGNHPHPLTRPVTNHCHLEPYYPLPHPHPLHHFVNSSDCFMTWNVPTVASCEFLKLIVLQHHCNIPRLIERSAMMGYQMMMILETWQKPRLDRPCLVRRVDWYYCHYCGARLPL